MANDAGTAYIEVRGDTSRVGKDISRGIDPHIDKSAKNVESKFGGAFKGAAAAATGAFAALGAVSFGKNLISGASDLNETISKSNTIFGANAKEIENWAGTAAKSMGQSKQGALDAAATFGNLFVQLGTGSGEAAKMSKEMVGLASDFASFHNADPTDVIEAMTAAFRGEYDAVQRYVPTINAAAVEQEALKMGLAKTTKELTAQDKALATQALLMKGAGDAMGDFARTSDGLANRQRIMSAQFQDMKDKIGTALLPVVLRLMEGFLGLGKVIGPIAAGVGTFIKNAFAPGKADVTWLDTLVGGVRAFIAAFRDASNGITSSGFAGAMERIAIAARGVFEFLKDNLVPVFASVGAAAAVAFGVWASAAIPAAAATIAAAAPVIALGVAVAALAGGFVYAYKHFEGFREVVDGVAKFLTGTVLPKIGQFAGYVADQFGNLVGFVRDHWSQIREAISHVVNVVQGIVRAFVAAVQALWRSFGDELVSVARAIWDQIRNVVETVINVIRGIIQTVLALINGDWGKAWDGIKSILSSVWEGMRETVVNALRVIGQVIEGALSALRRIWDTGWNAIKDVFFDAIGFILEGASRMLGWVPGVGGKLRQAADDFANFRDSVNSSLGGIDDKTIQLFLKTNDRNLGTAGDPIYANTGGFIPGYGDGDTVPAWLTPGEFVIRKKAVQALGVPYLEQLNAQGYAAGGLVDFRWHLPGVDGIRASAESMFDEMAATAAASAQEKFQAEADAAAAKRASGGGDVGGGMHVGTSYEGILRALDNSGMDYTVTSAYRPGDPGFHGRGKAVDLVGDMAAIFHTIAGFSGVNELFYDPIGWYLDEGVRHSGAIGDHDDHVHAATFDKGGWLMPGWTAAYNGTGMPEPVGFAAGGSVRPDGSVVQFGDDDFEPNPGDNWVWNGSKWVNTGSGSGPATADAGSAKFYRSGSQWVEGTAPVVSPVSQPQFVPRSSGGGGGGSYSTSRYVNDLARAIVKAFIDARIGIEVNGRVLGEIAAKEAHAIRGAYR